MCLDMLLQILRSLEGLATKLALVGLERNMDADVGSNVVTLHCGSATLTPGAGEVEVVGRFSANMSFTYVLLRCKVSFEELGIVEDMDLRREPLVMSIARHNLAIGTADFHQQH